MMRPLACIVLLGLILTTPAAADEVGKINRRANRLYDLGKYDEALKLYDEALLLDPSDSRLKMNRGSALYRLGQLDEAERSYIDALDAPPPSKKSHADAHYNLGSILYRQGEQLEEQGDIANAYEKYSQARDNYVNTLKLRPNDKNAKWNLQLAHQKTNLMRELKEQQMKQQNQQSQPQDDQGQQQEQEGQGQREQQEAQNQDEQQNQEERTGQQDGEEEQNQFDDGQQTRQQDEQDTDKDDAKKLIEQYADDDESLNRPPQRRQTKTRRPEKNW